MEIGGYFGLEELIHREYYRDLIALNTARNALAYLIKYKKIKKIFIPAFLCDSVYKVCEREKCSYEFYNIDSAFAPIFDISLEDYEWIYIVNYYGQLKNEVELKKKYKNMILDNVQAFFHKPTVGIDTIYSCRKFFGVADGAYLSSDLTIEEKDDTSKDRMMHILGRYEENATEYYLDYVRNEESYYELPIRKMSKLTHNLLGAIDYKLVKEKREENFHYLFEKLQGINGIDVRSVEGPFAYPFYKENGLKIKKRLAEKGIFVPTLWPTAVEFGGIAKDFSENILPLPCDQRYSRDEMKIIYEELMKIID